MTKITWLGEDTQTEAGPSFNVWNGIRFPRGEAVAVSDPHMIAKARVNQFYRVEEENESHGEQKTQEAKGEAYDFRKAENKSGYTPSKKQKAKKPKAAPAGPDAAGDGSATDP